MTIERQTDSLLTHIFARPVSRRISPLLVNTLISPMQVTIVGMIIGVTSAFISLKSGIIFTLIAAIGIEISHILDCVDGELARLSKKGSKFAAIMDPISDRVKDICIIFCSAYGAMSLEIFSINLIQLLAFLSVSSWMLYVYIVDAYLNPARKKISNLQNRLYLGLYDLFIYGAIFMLIVQVFEYFFVYIAVISTIGLFTQIIRLSRLLTSKN